MKFHNMVNDTDIRRSTGTAKDAFEKLTKLLRSMKFSLASKKTAELLRKITPPI